MPFVSNITLTRNQSLQQQICCELRRRIVGGELSAGMRLPTARKLAASWCTDQATVHRALATLSKESLLERTPRLGTFVRQRTEKLTQVGIYYPNDIWTPNSSRFQQTLNAAIHAEWRRLGAEVDVFIDSRPFAPEMEPWPALEQAVRERRIQAVIAPWVAMEHLAWLDKLQVPTAFLSSSKRAKTVTSDRGSFFRLALGALVRQGCASAAVLPCQSAMQPQENGLRHDYAEALDSLARAAAELGVVLRDEWMLTPSHYLESQAAVQRFGYQAMHELWRGTERPQGLIVTDDVAATGVVAALLEIGVQVPGQLSMAIQKNSDVDIFCPLPVTYVELDTKAVARALVEQIMKQFRGESVERVVIPFTLSTER